MAVKRMVEYSVSVPADSKASVSLNHTPGGTTGTIETENGRYDWAAREYVTDDNDE